MNHRMTPILLAAAALVAVGCSDATSPSTGRVNVLLTDAPIDLSDVSAVNVTLDRIILFGRDDMVADEEGDEMEQPGVPPGQGLTLNLLDYRDGATVAIAELDVPAGNYRKLRMYVTAAELVRDNPDDPDMPWVETVDVPSSKVDIPVPFSVEGGDNMDVILDFDAALSVQVNETSGSNKEYILRPVITPVGITRH